MPPDGELEPLFLLSDEPLAGDDPDDLDRDADARLIAAAVLGNRGPFTVGVYGEWGSGKTSLLHQVRRLLTVTESKDSDSLRYPYLVPVFFNAWRHEGEKEPLAFLASEIRDGIARHLKALGSPTDTAGIRAVSWLRSAYNAARAIAYGASLEAQLGVPGASVGAKFSPKDALDRAEKLADEREDPSSSAWKAYIDGSVAAGALRSMQADAERLDRLRPGEERRIPRVVVFIDDLDRCTPTNAVAILQSIKLAMAQPGFVFVATLNPEALKPHVRELSEARGQAAPGSGEAIYLDKIIQLPYALRLRPEQFGAFCTTLVEKRLKDLLSPELHETFVRLRPALRDTSSRNPRSLKRRINALLVEVQLAPADFLTTLDKNVHQARALYLGLSLLHATARSFGAPDVLSRLSAKQDLCDAIAEHGLRVLKKAMAETDEERLSRLTGKGPINPEAAKDFAQRRVIEAHGELIRELDAITPLNGLFKEPFGQRWLADRPVREGFEHLMALRPPDREDETPTAPPSTATTPPPPPTEPLPTASKTPATPPAPRVDKTADAGTAPAEPALPAAPTVAAPKPEPGPKGGPVSKTLREQIALIERALRESLNLPESAELSQELLGTTVELILSGEPLTDEGQEWLAHPDRGLKALTTLNLGFTRVTDAGVAALSSAETGLKALTTLSLRGTAVTDAGVAALSSAETGLKALTTLNLGVTRVTDAGVAALSAAGTGLKFLTTLDLGNTRVTDAGLAALSAAGTGLKSLTTLDLTNAQVTNAGMATLKRRWPNIRIDR